MQVCFIQKFNFLLTLTIRQKVYIIDLLLGPIAQLGERSVRIREVEGSNPFRSTIS